MHYEDFIGKVQQRARLASNSDAVRATRATLEVLAQRLQGGSANNLAAQLPSEIDRYLSEVQTDEEFDLNEFFRRVGEKEQIDEPEAVHHSRAVISVLEEAVTGGLIGHIREQLPGEYSPLFESGSEGKMRA